MVDTMLHEHGAFERSQNDNLWSRSSLIKCAKDTGHYPLAHTTRSGKRMISGFIGTAFAQEDAKSVKAEWGGVAD